MNDMVNISINEYQYKRLFTKIILGAIVDLKAKQKKYRDSAKKFLISDSCEEMCKFIGLDYNLIRSIDLDNPTETLNYEILGGRKQH